MGTPNVINIIKKFKGNSPVVKINYPTDSIGVIIEGSGNPIYLQIDAVPDDYFKDRQGELVKITLHATTANDRRDITVISKPLTAQPDNVLEKTRNANMDRLKPAPGRTASRFVGGRREVTNDTIEALNDSPGTNITRIRINNCTCTEKLPANWPTIQTPYIILPKDKFLLNRGGQREFGIPARLENNEHLQKFCRKGGSVTNN